MATRKQFIQTAGALTAGVLIGGKKSWASPVLESNRPPLSSRHFTSTAVEETIAQLKKNLRHEELAWLFENCFPNTLDTTVDFTMENGRPDTYVITGDIDAMWLRDSTAQVWSYLRLATKDKKLQQLLAGVINRQTKCILLDPYTNAFYKDLTKVSEWKETDITEMKPGVHERKWEIDSLCYPIRLAHRYWKMTGDTQPFDSSWKEAIRLTVKTFKEQQRKHNQGPYTFQRKTHWATDGVPISGYGYPVKPVGLICSIFRPSDDATIFPFLIPSNFFAVISLRQAAEMVKTISGDTTLAQECQALATEVETALDKYAVVKHPTFGEVYAFEVNGFGSHLLMDDANVPSLLAMPYLNAVRVTNTIYQNTRKLILSTENPFYYKGRAAQGIGSPHSGMETIWPISLIMQAKTSHEDAEIKQCVKYLVSTHAGTGFMHESFHKDDPIKFTRKWFAWANTLFGELILDLYQQKPALLNL